MYTKQTKQSLCFLVICYFHNKCDPFTVWQSQICSCTCPGSCSQGICNCKSNPSPHSIPLPLISPTCIEWPWYCGTPNSFAPKTLRTLHPGRIQTPPGWPVKISTKLNQDISSGICTKLYVWSIFLTKIDNTIQPTFPQLFTLCMGSTLRRVHHARQGWQVVHTT